MGCSQAKPSPPPSGAPTPAVVPASVTSTVEQTTALETPSKTDVPPNPSGLTASVENAVVDPPSPPPPPVPVPEIESPASTQQRSAIQRRASSRLAAELSQMSRQESDSPRAPGLSLRFGAPSPPLPRPDSIVPSEIDTVSQYGSEDGDALHTRAPTPPPPPEQLLVRVFLHRGVCLPSKPVFLVLQCGDSYTQTRVLEPTGDAVWDDTLDFLCKSTNETVFITAYSQSRHGASVVGTLEYQITEDNHDPSHPYESLQLSGLPTAELVMKVTTRVVNAHYDSHCKVTVNLLSVACRGKRPGMVCVRVTCGGEQVTSPPAKLLPIVIMAGSGSSKTPRSSASVVADPSPASLTNEVGFFGSLAGNDTEYLGYQLCRGLGGCVLIPPPISSTARDVSVTSTGSGSSDKSAAVSAGVKAICDDWLVAVPGEKSNGHKITFACAWNPENVRIEAWRCVADQDGRTSLRSCELNDVVDGSLVTPGQPHMIESRSDDVIVTFTAQCSRVNPPLYTGQTYSKSADRKLMEPPALTSPIQCLTGITHVTTVQVLSASSLELKPSKFSRTHDKTSGLFVSLSCGGQVYETCRVKVSDSPVWNESFEFYTSNPLPSRFEKDATGGPPSARASTRSDVGLPPTPKRKSFAATMSSPTAAASTPTSAFRFDGPKSVSDIAVDMLATSNLPQSRSAPSILTVRVYDSYGVAANSGASVVDVLTPFDYLGDAVINIPDAIAATETMPLTIKLNHVTRGTITLALSTTTLDCCAPKSNCTRITVLKTEGYRVHPQSQHHVECRIGSQGSALRTAICRNVSAPVWNQVLEALTSSPLDYITGTIIKDKSTPVGVFRVDEEHIPLLRPGVTQTVTIPVYPYDDGQETKAEDVNTPLGSLLLLVSSGPVDVPMAASLSDAKATSQLCCRIDVVGVIGVTGLAQLRVGQDVWTRSAAAVEGCAVWNETLTVDVPLDDRLKLTLRANANASTSYDLTLRNFGASTLEWIAFNDSVSVLMRVAVCPRTMNKLSVLDDTIGVIEIAPNSVSSIGNASFTVSCEDDTFEFPPDTATMKRSCFVWLRKSDSTKLASIRAYKPSAAIGDRQMIGSGLIEVAELASEFKPLEVPLVNTNYCPDNATIGALLAAEAARTCFGNSLPSKSDPLDVDARNLLSLRQFSGCREALECGQILLKQASHKPGVAHDSMTCSIRLIRKETVFAAFLLRLIGAKHGEEGIAGDQLGMLLSSLQLADALVKSGLESLKPNRKGIVQLPRIVNWLVTEDVLLSPDAGGLRSLLDSQSDTSLLFGIASSTTVLPSKSSQGGALDRRTNVVHCENEPWFKLLLPQASSVPNALVDDLLCLKQLFLSPTFAGLATPFAWSSGLDVTPISPDLRCFNDYLCRRTDVGISSDACVVVSPAACRMKWFADTEGAVKAISSTLTLQTLFRDSYEAFCKTFQSPEVLVCRFGALDAHRWCAPIDGTLAEPIAVSSPRDPDIIVQSLHSDTAGVVVWLVAFGNDMADSVSIVARGPICRGDDCGFLSFGCDRLMLIVDKDSVRIDEDLRRLSGSGPEVIVRAGECVGVIAPRVSAPVNTPTATSIRRKLSMQVTPTAAAARKPPATPQRSAQKRRHSAAVNVAFPVSSAQKLPSRHSSNGGSRGGMITATLGEGSGDASWLDDIKNPNDSNTDLLVGEEFTSPVLRLGPRGHVADFILEPDDVDAKLMADGMDLFDTDGDDGTAIVGQALQRAITPEADEFDTDL